MVFFGGTKQMEVVITGQVRAVKAGAQEVPTVVLELSSLFLGLCGVWHCHDEAVPLLPVVSRSFIRTSQFDAEFTISPRF
jgi:hypothetical protein